MPSPEASTTERSSWELIIASPAALDSARMPKTRSSAEAKNRAIRTTGCSARTSQKTGVAKKSESAWACRTPATLGAISPQIRMMKVTAKVAAKTADFVPPGQPRHNHGRRGGAHHIRQVVAQQDGGKQAVGAGKKQHHPPRRRPAAPGQMAQPVAVLRKQRRLQHGKGGGHRQAGDEN